MIGSILLAILTITLFLYTKWCSASRERLRLYEQHANKFFQNLQPLLDDKDTPFLILRTVDYLNSEIANPRAAIWALSALSLERKERSAASSEVAEFYEKRPELAKAFGRAVYHALFSVSYLNPIFGSALRTKLASAKVEQSPEVSRFFIAKFERVAHRHDHNSGCVTNGSH